MPYDYTELMGGYAVELFNGASSIAFMQGDEAKDFLEEAEKCETAEQLDNLISQYDN